jgi:hypothetical protein
MRVQEQHKSGRPQTRMSMLTTHSLRVWRKAAGYLTEFHGRSIQRIELPD